MNNKNNISKKPKSTKEGLVINQNTSHRWNRWKTISWVISVPIAIIAAYITSFGYIAPKISIEAPQITNNDNPYQSNFKLQNQGNFALHRIRYMVHIKDCILYDTGLGYLDIKNEIGEWITYGLPPNLQYYNSLEPMHIDTPSINLFTTPFREMCTPGREIVIQAEYKPSYYPFTKEQCFRFRLQSSPSGNLSWVPIANLNDVDLNFIARDSDKGWVFLSPDIPLFADNSRKVTSVHFAVIRLPPGAKVNK